mmetsp:Transcript_14643/g.14844  ORF Transcript_14643/g.14844 Transcript_14643/m.14844 type:complete len:101 (-) Transcript_14643:385-687(-)
MAQRGGVSDPGMGLLASDADVVPYCECFRSRGVANGRGVYNSWCGSIYIPLAQRSVSGSVWAARDVPCRDSAHVCFVLVYDVGACWRGTALKKVWDKDKG